MEASRRYQVTNLPTDDATAASLLAQMHDRMTEQPYPVPLASFDAHKVTQKVQTWPVLAEGRSALEPANRLTRTRTRIRTRTLERYNSKSLSAERGREAD